MSASQVIRGLLVLSVVAACATKATPPVAGPTPPTDHAAHAAVAPATDAAPAARLDEGRHLFETVCSTCHSVTPPAKRAPPMSHIAMRYRRVAGSDSAAAHRIAAFIFVPDSATSLMPAMARERFGLMPPIPLPESLRRAAAAYVLTLADSAGGMGHGMNGMGPMGGMGARARPPR